MSGIKFEGAGGGYFALPAEIAGESLRKAGADELRLAIYLYAHAGESLPEAQVADATGLSTDELAKAVETLSKQGVITLENGVVKPVPRGKAEKGRPRYTTDDIEAAVKRNPHIKSMLDLIQERMGALLPFEDVAALFSLYDFVGLPPDVIVMLVEFCLQNGKRSLRYMEKVAVDWATRGITSVGAAEEYIMECERRGTLEGRVRALLGMGKRALSKKERDMIEQWAAGAVTDELLQAAYERAADATGDPTLAYMNRILSDWREKGFKTAQEALGEKKPPAARKGGRGKSAERKGSLDLDDYEKRALERFHNDKSWG